MIRIILIVAGVKAGKREIMECIKVHNTHLKAYYLTSLNRKDVKNQQVELDLYGIETHVVNRDDIIEKIITDINENIRNGKRIILFWDECDYGSGKNQKLAKLFNVFIDNREVIHLLISATAHETLFSSIATRPDFKMLQFTPPKEYMGARYFIDNNLVFSPKPFLEKGGDTVGSKIVFTAHAFEVIRDSFTDTRNIGGIRVVGKAISTEMILASSGELERVLNRHFSGSFKGRPFKIKVIDADNELNWEDPIIRRGYTCHPLETNWLFFFNQTCTRGTDLKGWHANLAFWHDARPCNSCNINTLLQAILRPSHYSSCYKEVAIINGREQLVPTSQRIRLYVDKAAMTAAIGDFTDYKKMKGKAPTRTTNPRNNALYESHSVKKYEDIQHYFDTIGQTVPPLSVFPTSMVDVTRRFYMPIKAMGINIEDRERKIWDYANALRLKFQENRRNHYYIIPSYTDLEDPTTLIWVITRKLTKQESDKAKVFKATPKSMYEV